MDDVRPVMAKAVHRGGLTLGAVVKQALTRHYGSVKAAALTIGVDQSQLTRELDANKFAALERCDDEAKAAVASAIHDAFSAGDPKVRTRRLIRAIRQYLDELSEAV